MHSLDFQAVPRTDKVGSDTLEGPRFMAKQDSYKVQYSDFAAKQSVAYTRLCTRGHQRLAACTNWSQTEGQAVQSAKLCFQCNKLQWHTLHSTYQSIACAEKFASACPPFAL